LAIPLLIAHTAGVPLASACATELQVRQTPDNLLGTAQGQSRPQSRTILRLGVVSHAWHRSNRNLVPASPAAIFGHCEATRLADDIVARLDSVSRRRHYLPVFLSSV